MLSKLNKKIKTLILKKLDRYEARSAHNQLPVIWSEAKNCYITDIFGREYIDFTSGICVTNLGHSATVEAIKKQADKNLIYTYDYPNLTKIKLLKELTQLTNFEKAVLFTTGAEAVEATCKIMRTYTNKKNILSFIGSMHGKTALTSNLKGDYSWAYESNILNDIPVFEDDDFAVSLSKSFNPTAYLSQNKDNIAGVIIESYQGWSARFYNKEFIQKIVKFCKENNILVCFDEIQGGFGRTGKLFAYQHYEVKPDLVVVGKALANGLPLSAILGSAKILDSTDELTSTFAGSILSCASALEVLKNINKMIKMSKEKGEFLHKELKKIIKNKYKLQPVNSRGLLMAIITNTKEEADKIVFKALDKGLLLIWTHRNSVKIAPPLTISERLLEKSLEIFKEIL